MMDFLSSFGHKLLQLFSSLHVTKAPGADWLLGLVTFYLICKCESDIVKMHAMGWDLSLKEKNNPEAIHNGGKR